MKISSFDTILDSDTAKEYDVLTASLPLICKYGKPSYWESHRDIRYINFLSSIDFNWINKSKKKKEELKYKVFKIWNWLNSLDSNKIYVEYG